MQKFIYICAKHFRWKHKRNLSYSYRRARYVLKYHGQYRLYFTFICNENIIRRATLHVTLYVTVTLIRSITRPHIHSYPYIAVLLQNISLRAISHDRPHANRQYLQFHILVDLFLNNAYNERGKNKRHLFSKR